MIYVVAYHSCLKCRILKNQYAGMAELAAWRRSAPIRVDKRVRQGAETRRIAKDEQGDYVSSGHAGADAPKTIKYAGMAELADALDSGSSEATSCRFKSCYPHQIRNSRLIQSYRPTVFFLSLKISRKSL